MISRRHAEALRLKLAVTRYHLRTMVHQAEHGGIFVIPARQIVGIQAQGSAGTGGCANRRCFVCGIARIHEGAVGHVLRADPVNIVIGQTVEHVIVALVNDVPKVIGAAERDVVRAMQPPRVIG